MMNLYHYNYIYTDSYMLRAHSHAMLLNVLTSLYVFLT